MKRIQFSSAEREHSSHPRFVCVCRLPWPCGKEKNARSYELKIAEKRPVAESKMIAGCSSHYPDLTVPQRCDLTKGAGGAPGVTPTTRLLLTRVMFKNSG